MNVSIQNKRRKRATSMDNFDNILVNAAEFQKGRLYFVTLNTEVKPKSTASVHYFSIDTEFNYEYFYKDFGPLNLSVLYHYCMKVQKKLNSTAFQHKKIVHYTGTDDKKRVNAAYLIGCYSVIYLGFDPEHAYEILIKDTKKPYLEFRDASCGDPYNLSLLDCLKAIKKAHDLHFFDFNSFDYLEYEYYERVENGDLNWIIPNKFIAFCGPHNKAKIDEGYLVHSPETYFGYFRRSGVSTIVRLNKKVYDASKFVHAGFDHKDLYFVDGGTPNDKIMELFLRYSEEATGALAVHCKAGLGRTGTLIACYIMKHYKFTAEEATAWIRICRPGSVIGHQQTWLQTKQVQLWKMGDEYRKQKGLTSFPRHTIGIYPVSTMAKKNLDNVTGIMKKVDSMEINDKEENSYALEENKPSRITQGDKLNEIKAQRIKAKPLGSNLSEPRIFRTKVHVSTFSTPLLRTGKIMNSSIKVGSSTRVLTKRNELIETPSSRRSSQRKIVPALTSSSVMKTSDSKRGPKKKENVSWLPAHSLIEVSVGGNSIEKTAKRGKRALVIEKDKITPSVKVLRRSHGSGSTVDVIKGGGKFRLPSVKLNKTL